MRELILGLLINPSTKQVLLRLGPDKLWDGIRGIPDPKQIREDAMASVFREQTGIVTSGFDWRWVLTLNGPGYTTQVFRHFTSEMPLSLKEGLVAAMNIPGLHVTPLRPHLNWIIPLALDGVQGTITTTRPE